MPVEVEYVGVGSNAAFADLLPVAGTVVSGTTTQFSATAADSNESEIEHAVRFLEPRRDARLDHFPVDSLPDFVRLR